MKKIVLVDGSYYLYRAFHGLPPLTGPQRQPTNVVYGVANMLKSLVKTQRADYFVVVFDPRGKTFRHDIYPEYKANRPPMPEDLSCQIPPLFKLIKALGFYLMQIEKVEADDVLGTLTNRAQSKQIEVLISTGDKDMTQLVSKGVTLVDTMKNKYLDTAGVIKKMGVEPRQITDYLALTGDKSDNIPGVDGVGPKTAARWLAQYQNLETIMQHVNDIKGKAGENLRRALPHLPMSKKLTVIQCELDIPFDLDAFTPKEPDIASLEKIYTELGFRKWLNALENPQYELILNKRKLDLWVKKLKQSELFAFNVETTSLHYMQAQAVGVSFAVSPGESAYVPFAHDYEEAPQQLARDEVLGALKPLLEDASIGKTGHHLKYDRNVLLNHGIVLSGIRHDSMLESYIYNSVASRHDIDSLAERYLKTATIRYEDIVGKGAKQKSFNQIDVNLACRYAAENSDISLRLHHYFWPLLEKSKRRKKLYEKIEIPLIPVLSDIERHGVLIDTKLLKQQSIELKQRLTELRQQAYDVAEQEFNLDSPVQVRDILFEAKGLPVLRKTPKGQPSTAEDTLHELAQDFKLPRLILDYRMLNKLRTTFVDKLPQMIDPKSRRIHTSYHQAVTATGRLSSSTPNLQNIPARTPEGQKIRQAFIAPPGYRLLAADYSQIELRIMAHLSGDERLCRAFEKQQDVHVATAAEIFSTNADNITKSQRRSAKAINFGLIYGMSAFGLAKQLGLDLPSAKQYISTYFQRYPQVQSYMKQIKEKAAELGYVETLFGRRLYLPEIHSRTVQHRRYAERTAINAPMQGTAADIIKQAMVALHDRLRKSDCDAQTILQAHDELLIETAEKDIQEVTSHCESCMVDVVQLRVPLVVVIGEGRNWSEAH